MEHDTLVSEKMIGCAITVHKDLGPGLLERPDLIVEKTVVVEVKSALRWEDVFTAQMLTYLRLTKHRVGLIINFTSHYFEKASNVSSFKAD